MKPSVAVRAAAIALVAATALPALAQEANPLSFNVSVTSDYRYRGISQTRLKPALQGGVDYAHSSGFYIGAWASTIKWIKDGGGDANVEIDTYAGYKTEVGGGVTVDVGFLRYNYPSNKLPTSANTNELYGAVSYGPATLKYSHSVSNLFGFADSKNSGYLDLSATFDVGSGFTVTPHIGRQTVKHSSDFSYTDYALTVNKDFEGFTFGLGVVATSTDAYIGGKGKDLGKNGVVLSVKKVF
ncbi:TorF family putative porin [Mitsuaria sp. GD03876]|uniref:TorF family putative porin n=1 Tax=Mitsuaria sp. GD03876 TaxID=2975399 RepID=UPI002446917E|nr:TorF family putative porin [Mitsuaria sp. GD03876]MDH0863612.1 TorF family putative porin [Mitsuaria sp. GD03876]